MVQFIKYLFILPVRFYQRFISPLTPPTCCYQPSCSQYMIDSIQEWGIFKGIWLGLKRLVSCHPWSKGGYDPVPKKHEHDHHHC
ncbi:MAG: membrane protein insertion efficiency factor YidD [Saprospiraceae bacterium]|nr:membrane protein insertion efficiency factor YidD [Saprospiraceae bacterium]MCF8249725.1 membrane protein insertion efficiency factor YidD [Saprospiraceae bacterium]MCF8282511.1 membrane protein insertion efficiency factor YidD [Bacteroidales bacterium]MCF8314096.1 membrane protein insertion efficiency factor YidD [Saprospiraceae bacterium]MCF8442841.1 membrane protein insertion efficiency factor YidD [Saprospiraceae bacterium]